MQRSALCRSRRELSNEYLLAKIGVDTAENEPIEVWGKYSILFTGVLSRHPTSAPLVRERRAVDGLSSGPVAVGDVAAVAARPGDDAVERRTLEVQRRAVGADALLALVERFDIKPYSDFSAKI